MDSLLAPGLAAESASAAATKTAMTDCGSTSPWCEAIASITSFGSLYLETISTPI